MSIGGCGCVHVSVSGCVSSFGSEKVSKHLIKSDNPLNICIYKKGDVEPRRGRIWVWLTKDFNQNSQCRLNLISTIFYFFIASLFGSRFGFYSKHIYSGEIDNKSVNDSMKWLSLYLMWLCIGLVPQPTKSANKPKIFFFDVSKMRAMSDIEFERFMKICVSFFSCVYSSLIPGHKRRSIQAESIQSWAHSCGCASMDLYFMNSARGSISSMYNIVICWALCRQAEWHFED